MVKNIKIYLVYLLKVIAAFAASIVIISIFCIGYRYSGVREIDPLGVTDYKWKPGQFKSTMVEGFAWNRIDSLGYVNPKVPEQIDILLMGSSHQEALNVAMGQSTASQLDSLLPKYSVYNVGMSGHTFFHCLSRLKPALAHLAPKKYVLIETWFVPQGPKMSWFLDGNLKPYATYQGFFYQMQKIPAFKWFVVNAETWANLGTFKKKTEESLAEYSNEQYEQVSIDLLNVVKKTADEYGVIPIIFYNPAQQLNKNGTALYPNDTSRLPIFKKSCEKTGVVFVDPTEEYDVLFKEHHRLAHGFNNTAVGVGHLNKYGHRALAEAIAKEIKAMEANR